MEIIAKTTGGCLIQATENEVKEIIRSVTGENPYKLSIGQKIPAIDYASTITKLKELGESDVYNTMLDRVGDFNSALNCLRLSIKDAQLIDK